MNDQYTGNYHSKLYLQHLAFHQLFAQKGKDPNSLFGSKVVG
jgi:hypothetical protein